ncbi:MAG: ATP-binding protein, partial [Pseudomonadota bacterium]
RWVWFLSMDTIFDRHADGSVCRHLGVAADITLQKEAEQRAIEASHAAEVANEDLRTFAYSISHDMKAPSNTLHLLLTELQDSYGAKMPPDAQELVSHALETVASMERRIERILDYTRLIDGKSAFQPVPLEEVLSGVLSDMTADIAEASAQIEVGPLPVVSGSRAELKVLFQNLIKNAIKFRADDRAPYVRIFDASDPDEGDLRVTVADNGIGIPKESASQVFEMFKRLHSDRTHKGCGIGLAICRRIAVSHGGDIFLKSDVDVGSAFTIQLRPSGHIWRRRL